MPPAIYATTTAALQPELDTIVLEPHLGLATLSWRARAPLPRKPSQLREIWVGAAPPGEPVDLRGGRPVFARLGEAVTWLDRQRTRAELGEGEDS